MKDFDNSNNSAYDIRLENNLTLDENSIFNIHEQKMEDMIDRSHSIVKKIKKMSEEINSDLQFQNKIINDIGIIMSKTDNQLNKNNSKIEDILGKTSSCSLIILAFIQVMAIIFLILL